MRPCAQPGRNQLIADVQRARITVNSDVSALEAPLRKDKFQAEEEIVYRSLFDR